MNTLDVLINKATTIERSVLRAKEEYQLAGEAFSTHHTHQDAAILNIQRACEAAVDMGQHWIRQHRLGAPQGARDVFRILEEQQIIDPSLSQSMKNMVGFRNIAVHDYQRLQIPIVVSIIQYRLDDCRQFSQALLKHAKHDDSL